MKLEDLGVKVKKIRKEKAPFDTGGQDEMKLRAKKWKIAEREEKLEQIRMQKLMKLQMAQQQKEEEEKWQQAIRVWQKIDWVMQRTMKLDAYNFLHGLRMTEPEVYKKIFRAIVEPRVINNIDTIITHLLNKGIKEEKKVTFVTVMKHYRHIKGIKPTIKVQRGDKLENLSDRLENKGQDTTD